MKPKQINVYCRICKKPLLVTDTSKRIDEIGEISGRALMFHLFIEHKESFESIVKRICAIHNEYITPSFDEIEKLFEEK